jgi:hypothetical protein
MKVSENKLRRLVKEELGKYKRRTSKIIFEGIAFSGNDISMLKRELGLKVVDDQFDKSLVIAWRNFVKKLYDPIIAGAAGRGVRFGGDVPSPKDVSDDWEKASVLLGYSADAKGMQDFILAKGQPAAGSNAQSAMATELAEDAEMAIGTAIAVVDPLIPKLEAFAATGWTDVREADDAIAVFGGIYKILKDDEDGMINTKTLMARYAVEKGEFEEGAENWFEKNPVKAAIAGAAIGSVAPGIGTLAGAAVGGGAALVGHIWASLSEAGAADEAQVLTNMSSTTLATDLVTMSKDIGKTGFFSVGQTDIVIEKAMSQLGKTLRKIASNPAASKENAVAKLDKYMAAILKGGGDAAQKLKTAMSEGALQSNRLGFKDLVIKLLNEGTWDEMDPKWKSSYGDYFGKEGDGDTEEEDSPGAIEKKTKPKKKSSGRSSNEYVRKMQEILISDKDASGGLPGYGADGKWGSETTAAFRKYIKHHVKRLGKGDVASDIADGKWTSTSSVASATFGKDFSGNPQGAYEFVKYLSTGDSKDEEEIVAPKSGELRTGSKDTADLFHITNMSGKNKGSVKINPKRSWGEDAQKRFNNAMKALDSEGYGFIVLHGASDLISGDGSFSEDEFMSIDRITGHKEPFAWGKGKVVDNSRAWRALKKAGLIKKKA